jgi:hypothetical protein
MCVLKNTPQMKSEVIQYSSLYVVVSQMNASNA